jgi:hypothetical protein
MFISHKFRIHIEAHRVSIHLIAVRIVEFGTTPAHVLG